MLSLDWGEPALKTTSCECEKRDVDKLRSIFGGGVEIFCFLLVYLLELFNWLFVRFFIWLVQWLIDWLIDAFNHWASLVKQSPFIYVENLEWTRSFQKDLRCRCFKMMQYVERLKSNFGGEKFVCLLVDFIQVVDCLLDVFIWYI